MGTSSSTSGSGSATPLVPTWLEEPLTTPPAPEAGGIPSEEGNGQGADQAQPNQPEDNGKPPIPLPPQPGRFRSARSNFSRFAGSGGTDRAALGRAVRDYVRRGTGGGRRAVQRMGQSRGAARTALGVLRAVQRDGSERTLRQLDLQHLTGHGVGDVLTGLTDIVCGDGATVDAATARDAWLDTVAELDRFAIEDMDSLSAEQIKEFFLTFIGNTIERRLCQEIAVNAFRFANVVDELVDRQFADYIQRTVRDSFTGDLTELATMSDVDVATVVDQTYLEALSLLEVLGDRP